MVGEVVDEGDAAELADHLLAARHPGEAGQARSDLGVREANGACQHIDAEGVERIDPPRGFDAQLPFRTAAAANDECRLPADVAQRAEPPLGGVAGAERADPYP